MLLFSHYYQILPKFLHEMFANSMYCHVNHSNIRLFQRTTDPSSQLRSDGEMPIAFSESRQFDGKMKVSMATIFERTAREDALRGV